MKWFFGFLGLVVAAVLLAAGPSATTPQAIEPDQALLRMLPPDTGGVVFFDVAELRDVAIIRGFIEDQAGIQVPAPIEEFTAVTGLDPVNAIDQVMTGRSGPDDFLSVVRVSVDSARIEQFFEAQGAASELYGSSSIYRADADNPEFGIAFPTDNIVILGPIGAIQAGLDRMSGGPSVLDNVELMAEITAIEDGNQLWGVGSFADLVPSEVVPPMAVDLIEALERLRYQMRIDSGVTLRLAGTFATPDTATRAGDLLRGFVALGKMGSAQQPELIELLDGLQVENLENSVEISFAASQELLDSIDLNLPELPIE